ncbi:MAG: hypothetical protein PHQ76_01800 [Caldisericia bacterium]|nr:hypothetical protein [Caldisericia bacterium]
MSKQRISLDFGMGWRLSLVILSVSEESQYLILLCRTDIPVCYLFFIYICDARKEVKEETLRR